MTLKRSGALLLAYVDEDFRPVEPEQAFYVKILYPNGARTIVTTVEARRAERTQSG